MDSLSENVTGESILQCVKDLTMKFPKRFTLALREESNVNIITTNGMPPLSRCIVVCVPRDVITILRASVMTIAWG